MKEHKEIKKKIKRIARCGACGTYEGHYHTPSCDMEICPFCGSQLIGCDCCYTKLGLYNVEKNGTEYCGLSHEVFSHGLNEKQQKRWGEIRFKKGLIPFVQNPIFCHRCGRPWPQFFRVLKDEWKKYVPLPLQKKILCKNCYAHMKYIFPNGWEHLGSDGYKKMII